MSSARAFLAGIVDYAGLFPPASLDMQTAVRAYAAYRMESDRDLLGRFIVPVSRLEEFSHAADALLPRDGSPWELSAIAADIGDARKAVLEFNRGHSSGGAGRAVCDTVEMPVATTTQIEAAVTGFREDFKLFLEVPVQANPQPLIAAISGTRAAAKIRTGGIVESAIPPSTQIVTFMQACIEAGVKFKATAGLHHAVRGKYRLTYEAGSACAMMHGYVNVFLAAAFCAAGASDTALAVLEETDASAFHFDARGGWWREAHVDHASLERTRQTVALSFGSCSFEEPVGEARQLHLI